MQEIALPVKDALLIQHPRYHDHRGFLEELFNIEKYPASLTPFFPVQQVTAATSKKDVVRGLHFSPYCKLLSVIKGSLYDVVVDLRPDSPTYLKWAGVVLSESNCRQLFIPPHCGHGYFTLEDDTSVVYCQGGCFRPATDLGISPFDTLVNVTWRLDKGGQFVISDKDKGAPLWADITPGALSIPVARERVLIVGVNSQTGLALQDVLEGRGQYVIYGTTNAINQQYSMKFDLSTASTDRDQFHTILQALRPNIVIVCSGYNHVDGCETTPEKSEITNVKGTQVVVNESHSVGAKVVFFSSNYVFGNNSYTRAANHIIGDNGLKEEDETSPPNIYAKHKLQNEAFIQATCPDSLIIRTSNVFGPSVPGRNNNFVYQMSRAMRNKRKYICSTTELVVPSYTYDIALGITALIQARSSGIYHVCGPEAFSKYDWAMRVGKHLNLATETIESLDGQLDSPAARPQAAVMCTAKIRSVANEVCRRTFSEAMEHWAALGKGEPL